MGGDGTARRTTSARALHRGRSTARGWASLACQRAGALASALAGALALCVALAPAAARAHSVIALGPVGGISACALGEGEASAGCAVTGASGEYTIKALRPGSYRVRFSPFLVCPTELACSGPDYAERFFDEKASFALADPLATTAGSVVTGIDAQLVTGGTIAGTVTSEATHAPIVGTTICYDPAATEELFPVCDETGPGGEYAFAGLTAGEYKVFFQPEQCLALACRHYREQWYSQQSGFNTATPVHVAAGATTGSVDFTLAPVSVGAISGRVEGGSTPLAGAMVCLNGPIGGSCVNTNANGEYTVEYLPPGSYTAYFQPPAGANYLARYWDEKASASEETSIAVKGGETVAGIDASLLVGAEIKGTITGALGLAGVEACARGPQTVCAETNASGEYTLAGLQAGTYKVWFSAGLKCRGEEDCQNYLAAPEALQEAVAGSEVKTVAPVAMQRAAIVEGTVGGATGGAHVRACAKASGTEIGCANTNAAGHYAIDRLPTGTYEIVFFPIECPAAEPACTYTQNYLEGSIAEVKATAGAATPGADMTMSPGAEISGKVLGCAPREETLATTSTTAAATTGAASTTTPAPTPHGAAAVAPRATVRGRGAMLTLRCAGSGACDGTVALVARASSKRVVRRDGRAHAVRGVRNVVIGRASFTIAAGRRATVAVHLDRTGMRLLRRAGRRGLRVKVGGTGVVAGTLLLRQASEGRRGRQRRRHRHGR